MDVLIIEQHPRTRHMLEGVVRAAFDPVRVHCEKTLETAKRAARRIDTLRLVLLDLDMPGCTGADALAEFRDGFPSVPVVVVCGSPDVAIIRASINAGAAGYLPKNRRRAPMVAALQLVMAGCPYVPEELLPWLLGAQGHEGVVETLTERQRDVLRLVLKGHANLRIARELGIALGTVKHHVSALFEAFAVSTRSELIAIAAQGGVRSDGTPITEGI